MRAYQKTVSIHAPTRGATSICSDFQVTIRCFNPRAYTRRDEGLTVDRLFLSGFNPRAYTRRDPSRMISRTWAAMVSIHAPTRGATAFRDRRRNRDSGFNPRAYTRRDGNAVICVSRRSQFQSTRLHEARQSRKADRRSQDRFNPRAYTRRDSNPDGWHGCHPMFQSTRLHEARQPCQKAWYSLGAFACFCEPIGLQNKYNIFSVKKP